jgi:hypothetical protein
VRRAPSKIEQTDCPKKIWKKKSGTWQTVVQILCTIHQIIKNKFRIWMWCLLMSQKLI